MNLHPLILTLHAGASKRAVTRPSSHIYTPGALRSPGPNAAVHPVPRAGFFVGWRRLNQPGMAGCPAAACAARACGSTGGGGVAMRRGACSAAVPSFRSCGRPLVCAQLARAPQTGPATGQPYPALPIHPGRLSCLHALPPPPPARPALWWGAGNRD